MSTTFNWNIEKLECYPQKYEKENIVVTVYWCCTGINDIYSASSYGSCNVSYDEAGQFTPYAELTKEQVLSWVWNNANVSDVAIPEESLSFKEANEAAIEKQIQIQINPPIVITALPWVQS